jgi:FtsH-binding integral membrane protein
VVPRAVLGVAGVAGFGIAAILVSIPSANVIWSVAGLAIFGGYTIVDFIRLRRAGADSAVAIAASISGHHERVRVPARAVRRRA